MKTQKVEMSRIKRDDRIQSRAHLDIAAINEYAEAMADGKEFPPVVVYDDGETLWLSEGFHRHAATDQVGWLEIMAEVRQGTFKDAVLNSAASNQKNGVRRSNPDKRRAVELVLSVETEWSDNQIAEWTGVSQPTVGTVRSSLINFISEPATRTYVTKHGTVATMRVGNIGHSRPAPVAQDEDEGEMGLEDEEQEQDESTGEEEGAAEERPANYRPSNGLLFCNRALGLMRQIHKNDIQKTEAFDKMQRWLEKNR